MSKSRPKVLVCYRDRGVMFCKDCDYWLWKSKNPSHYDVREDEELAHDFFPGYGEIYKAVVMAAHFSKFCLPVSVSNGIYQIEVVIVQGEDRTIIDPENGMMMLALASL